MRNPFRRAPEPPREQPFARVLAELAAAQETPTIDEIVARWSAMYDEQTGVLEQTLQALEEQTQIVDQARNFMNVLAQRTHGGEPLFVLNKAGGPADVETLRHAIISLQALLAGADLPPAVTIDRVLH